MNKKEKEKVVKETLGLCIQRALWTAGGAPDSSGSKSRFGQGDLRNEGTMDYNFVKVRWVDGCRKDKDGR
jgi:hypothetical protein